MRSSLGQAVVTVLLAIGGLVLWRAAELEQRVAAAERQLVTLRYQDAAEVAALPASPLARLLPGEARTLAAAKGLQATSSYWQSDYAAVEANPDARLLAANASYRGARRDGGPWQAFVNRLDTVAKGYAEVVRNEPTSLDAAFNYEYVVRLRAMVAARKQPVAPVDEDGSKLTIHGREGAPPPMSDLKQFKMIVPMRPDERLEAERAGKAGAKVRKG